MNNADLGMTLQSRVCTKYNLEPCEHAKNQFQSNYNNEYVSMIDPLIGRIFDELNSKPIECTTFKESSIPGERLLPYNFVLENKKTVSIRTSKGNVMVAPRVVGQAGYDVINMFFGDIIEEKINNQEQIRNVVYKHIEDMLPVFVTYLLNSDYTVWVYPVKGGTFDYIIIDNNTAVDIEYSKEKFAFTKPLEKWKESVSLKYNGITIAEIQTHKNRTFKFRFRLSNLIKFFREEKMTNETIGISAEYVVCKLFGLKYPDSFKHRISKKIVSELTPVIKEAFTQIPATPIKHTGSDSGVRKGKSKCPYDFKLTGNETLSLKTNDKKVCPPEVGQPTDSTFYLYFKHLINEDFVDEYIFKNLVLNDASKMLPIYAGHLFDSNYLLWLCKRDGKWKYKVLAKDSASGIVWEQKDITFTKPTVEDWNESNTIKYKGKSIGEFQYHHHRNCYKFRFDFDNLVDLISESEKDK